MVIYSCLFHLLKINNVDAEKHLHKELDLYRAFMPDSLGGHERVKWPS